MRAANQFPTDALALKTCVYGKIGQVGAVVEIGNSS
jgi:hypothetical protein